MLSAFITEENYLNGAVLFLHCIILYSSKPKWPLARLCVCVGGGGVDGDLMNLPCYVLKCISCSAHKSRTRTQAYTMVCRKRQTNTRTNITVISVNMTLVKRGSSRAEDINGSKALLQTVDTPALH